MAKPKSYKTVAAKIDKPMTVRVEKVAAGHDAFIPCFRTGAHKSKNQRRLNTRSARNRTAIQDY